MENGPFRMSSRSADKDSSSRPAADPPEKDKEPKKEAVEEPKRPTRAPATPPASLSVSKKMKKIPLGAIIAGVLVIAVIITAWFVFANRGSEGASPTTGINKDKYQAILLTNGEAYLGKLSILNDQYLRLKDIFYLKPQAEGTENAGTQTTDQSVQLIKFGGEVQGPEDEMIIARDQVLYYQNLKPDGKASKAIEEYKKSN